MAEKVERRRERMLALIRERRSVDVGTLAQALGITAQTARRDIAQLCRDNKIRRHHGGAEAFESQLNQPCPVRQTTNESAKALIAERAAQLIPDGATLFISIGTIPAMVARALQSHRELTVVTNNLNAAMALSTAASNRILIPAGELRVPDCDIVGPEVLPFMAGYRAEYAIFGVAGIDAEGQLLDFYREEVAIRQQMAATSATSILVADRSKFGRSAPALGGHLREPDYLVLDALPDPYYRPLLDELGERLIRLDA